MLLTLFLGSQEKVAQSYPAPISFLQKAFRSKQAVPITSLDSTGIFRGGGWGGAPLGEQDSLSVEKHSLVQRECAASHPFKDIISPGIGKEDCVDGLRSERDFLHPLGISSSWV